MKIYIPRLEGHETLVHEWSSTEFRRYFSRKIAENVQYVRPDVFISKAKGWIAEIHRVCDITDEHGYKIDLRELQARFEQYMEN